MEFDPPMPTFDTSSTPVEAVAPQFADWVKQNLADRSSGSDTADVIRPRPGATAAARAGPVRWPGPRRRRPPGPCGAKPSKPSGMDRSAMVSRT
jgi:hypothetical protein